MPLNNVRKMTERGVLAELLYRLQNPLGQWWGPLVGRFESNDPAGEEHAWLGGVPQMQKQSGDPDFKQLRAPSIIVKNEKWNAGIEIDVDDWDADKRGLIQQRINAQAGVVLSHPGILLMLAMAQAEAKPCYDGSMFFDDDHSEGESGVQSNLITATAVNPASPTASETSDAILSAVQQLHGIKDDHGNECNMDAMDFLVCHPTGMTKSVIKSLGAELIGGGDTNVVAGNKSGFKFTAQVMPRWTGNKIAVFRRRAVGEGSAFIWQVFQEAKPTILGRDSEYCSLHDKLLFKHRGVYNLAFGRWQEGCLVNFVAP
jgi:hypothetical protein